MKHKTRKRLSAFSEMLISILLVGVVVNTISYCILKIPLKEVQKDPQERITQEEKEIRIVKPKHTGTQNPSTRIPVKEAEKTEDPFAEYTTEELDMLVQIAMAEAEGEDVEGKAYVIRVVLNRVEHSKFPDTISEVIYQPNQFTSVRSRRWQLEPNEECYDALDLVFHDNWDDSNGALFFEATTNGEDTWHSRNLKYLGTYGNHKFYTFK